MLRTEAVVDLSAIRANVATLKAATRAEVMAVVKADGYGHGLVPSARAAVAGGATWLGTAVIEESLALRAAGHTTPILAWLWPPGETSTVSRAVAAGIDLSVSGRWQLDAVQAVARELGRAARVHLKIDTGLSRNGTYIADWPDLLAAAAKAQAAGEIDVVGVWSHFAYADEPGHPVIAHQIEAFHAALAAAARAGIEPQLRHLANSAATLTLPEAHFGLVPAMTLRAGLAAVKRVRAGEGVSYGHAHTTERETTLVLVPLGYADGIPRSGTNVGPVSINGQRFTVSGRVCMDQFVLDVGDLPVAVGDHAVLFGPGHDGEPRAQDWADAVATIHYEIVTRIGPRVPRTYVG